jgi:hypothetical protein
MTLNAEAYAQIEEQIADLEAAGMQLDERKLAGLSSISMVLAFCFREAKADGADDEAALDAVEALVRHTTLTTDEVRQSAQVLKALGFATLAARLKGLAGRRVSTLKPLP